MDRIYQSTKKERIGWYLYDWANSAFSTSVLTVFLGPYLTTVAKNSSDSNGYITIFGISIFNGSYFPYLVSFSVLLQVLILPIAGAIADYTKKKKILLGLFAYLGSLATIFMYFVDDTNYLLGGLLFIIANICFGISIVIYNSYLVDIAEPERRDEVSSIGWAIGYLGGGTLLAINLIFFSNAESLNISQSTAIRISLASAGLWWALFTIFPMLWLRNQQLTLQTKQKRIILSGLRQLKNTLLNLKYYPVTILFLLAYFFYNDGVQTVIAVSSQFGQEELNLSISTLTTVILIVQFVAFGGALLFKFISNKIGAKNSILISIFIWILIIFYAFSIMRSEFDFYLLGVSIALVLGGIQALSRSLYSQLIPKDKEAEYFSLYEITEKGTSWLGPFFFGLSLQFTNSYRLAVLSLAIFFIIGFILLSFVNINKGKEDLLIIS